MKGECFQLRLKILLLMMHHLEWSPEYSKDPRQPMWQQNDDARGPGPCSLLCDSWTVIDCTLWLWTPPPLAGYAGRPSWGFRRALHIPRHTKCLLIFRFHPLWNSLASIVTLGQNYLGWWKFMINTCFWRLECHQFKNIRLSFIFKHFKKCSKV